MLRVPGLKVAMERFGMDAGVLRALLMELFPTDVDKVKKAFSDNGWFTENQNDNKGSEPWVPLVNNGFF